MDPNPNWAGFLADSDSLTAFRLSRDKVTSGSSQRESLARLGKVDIFQVKKQKCNSFPKHINSSFFPNIATKHTQQTEGEQVRKPVSKHFI